MMGDLRISMAGTGAVLLDAARPVFDDAVQNRVWAAARGLQALPWVTEAVPGMNNLLVTFDPLGSPIETVIPACREAWENADVQAVTGRSFEIPVQYGGPAAEDLAGLAAHAGLPPEEVVRRHAAATYRVGAIGAMPGYPYLFGLDPSLAWARRAVPRAGIPAGSVIIGGAQAGIMPCTAPSGWHVIGLTTVQLFDPIADPPCLLRPGDTIRFTISAMPA